MCMFCRPALACKSPKPLCHYGVYIMCVVVHKPETKYKVLCRHASIHAYTSDEHGDYQNNTSNAIWRIAYAREPRAYYCCLQSCIACCVSGKCMSLHAGCKQKVFDKEPWLRKEALGCTREGGSSDSVALCDFVSTDIFGGAGMSLRENPSASARPNTWEWQYAAHEADATLARSDKLRKSAPRFVTLPTVPMTAPLLL